MTAPPEDTTADLHAVIAALRAERDAALSEKAALSEELAAHAAALAQRNSEYGERIVQQAATIDVLKAMSASPGDAGPVFQLIVERARAFCDADQANLALLDGDMLHLEATSGASASYPAQFPRPVDATTTFGRAIIARDVSALLIAITACSAKVLSSSICVAETSPGMLRPIAMAPTGAPLRSNGTATTARTVASALEVLRK
jgi:hypothetical protein